MPFGPFENPFFLAPMEAVNCASFRVLCRRRGASIVYTDMIDADAFCASLDEVGEQATIKRFLNAQSDEHPLAVQLGGGNAERLLRVLKAVEPFADVIDLNAGCPLPEMLGRKGGAYLCKHPEQLVKLVKELRSATKKPFTVKIRAGWDEHNAVEVARMLEQAGIDALTLHPRTLKQGFRDKPDWQLARQVKEAITIPFILSGGVTNAYMAKRAFEHTKCDYIMVARAAQINPSVFQELILWKNAQKLKDTYVKSTAHVRKDFEEFLLLYKEREHAYRFGQLQDHALWLATGSKNVAVVKQQLLVAQTEEELAQTLSTLRF